MSADSLKFGVIAALLIASVSAVAQSVAKDEKQRAIDMQRHHEYMKNHQRAPAQFATGTQNDGWWYCGWNLGMFECSNGEFHCTCPGNKASIHFIVGCCYNWPGCGVICNKQHSCYRYRNCNTCRDRIGEWDVSSCHSCLPGFLIGPGDCSQDLNECATGNAGCQHRCTNAYGSYFCQCNDGYKLNADKHTCQHLSCGAPAAVPGATITPTANWMHGSYAKYTCDDPNQVLVGSAVRKCDGKGASASWAGQSPKCVDACDAPSSGTPAMCGPSGTSEDKCRQLGCCYNAELDLCTMKPGDVYIRYKGEKPNDGMGYASVVDSAIDGCAYNCDVDDANEAKSCGSFGIQSRGTDQANGVDLQTCHLYESRRSTYLSAGQINADAAFDLYNSLVEDDAGLTYDAEKVKRASKLTIGCFAEDPNHRDLPVFAFIDIHHMTGLRCADTCSELGYRYAGVLDGTQCFCGNGQDGIFEESEECQVCESDRTQTCGSTHAFSVYMASHDARYLGCYLDEEMDRDIPLLLWGAGLARSAEMCVDECLVLGHEYAAVQEGGACYCGATFGKHGGIDEMSCNVSCNGWQYQNCGGKLANAIYRTEIVKDIATQRVSGLMGQAFDSASTVTSIPTKLFSVYPGLRNFATKNFVLYSAKEITTSVEDACQGDCYQPCGEIYQEKNLDIVGETVIVRQFYLRLADLSKFISSNTKRVFVHVQTLMIDMDFHADYALSIRARQIIMDRDIAHKITISGDAGVLGHDQIHVQYFGPYPDLLHQELSVMCARILLDSGASEHVNAAWGILTDIIKSDAETKEQSAFIANTRMFAAELKGIDRSGTNYIPIYTKSHLAKILETYGVEIEIYKNDYERLLDPTLSDAKFLEYAEEMQNIYVKTDVLEAQDEFKALSDELLISNLTVQAMWGHYEESVAGLDEARDAFLEGIAKSNRNIKGALKHFVQSMYTLVHGIQTGSIREIKQGLTDLKNNTGIYELTDDMIVLTDAVANMQSLAHDADKIMRDLINMAQNFDYDRTADNIESVIMLQVNVVRWQSLKDSAVILLSLPEVVDIDGCMPYTMALMDTANWGEVLTRAMVEYSELLRQTISARYVIEVRLEKTKRINELISGMKADVLVREELLISMMEETYDVRMDLNNVLIAFCRAYFYENLNECRDIYKPSFGGSLSDLILKVNAARRDSMFLPAPPSSVSRIITIKNVDNSPECTDYKVCPITYLKNEGILMYDIKPLHDDLKDLHQYKLAEIILQVKGLKATTENKNVKFTIESSGVFQSVDRGVTYDFLTKPVLLGFEYDISTGHISLRADVYNQYREIIQFMTPYTTWVMPVDQTRSAGMDWSDVTEITMRLEGSAIVGYNAKGLPIRAAAPEVTPEQSAQEATPANQKINHTKPVKKNKSKQSKKE